MKTPYSGNGYLKGLSSVMARSMSGFKVSLHSVMFARWRNRLTAHFSERIPVINWCTSVDIRPHVEVMSVRLWHTDSTYILRQTDSLTIPHVQHSQNVLGTFRLSARYTEYATDGPIAYTTKPDYQIFGKILYKRSQPAIGPVLFLVTKTLLQNLL